MNPFEISKQYFPTPLQEFQFYDKYSRFNYDLGRRETWVETVTRAVNFLRELSNNLLPEEDYQTIKEMILNMEIMPSMRLLAMAGDAARRTNICIYNCSFMGIENTACFGEALLISMSGCGVGYSVEKKFVDKLPTLPKTLVNSVITRVVEDTTEGWKAAIDTHITNLYGGVIVKFDYSNLRPPGSVLRTKGGRASGPGALIRCINFITNTFHYSIKAQYDKLRAIDVHDIMCSIGDCAVSGGTRRTAMISLFDYDDLEMRNAKQFRTDSEHRAFSVRYNANNSAVWEDLDDMTYLQQMTTMFYYKNGEPGIFSRRNAQNNAPDRRDGSKIEGTNPCGEINLRNMQFCNLTSVICRKDDTLDSLLRKVKYATIVGTIQSMATHFPGLRPQWKYNCEKERLLGVGLDGIMDCDILNNDLGVRSALRSRAKVINNIYAEKLGITPSHAITCIKPSGNTSQLVNCSSGMHPRYSQYYIRNVRVGVHSPVYKVLYMSGVPMVPENGQTEENMTTAVASFPVKSPDNTITRKDLTAVELMEKWKQNKLYYTEHNPSVTIYYDENEIMDVIKWVWENKNIIGGMTFLPRDNAKYDNMPYVEISEQEYNALVSKFPKIDWSLIEHYEKEDYTTAAQEVACMSGACELV